MAGAKNVIDMSRERALPLPKVMNTSEFSLIRIELKRLSGIMTPLVNTLTLRLGKVGLL